MLVMSPRKTYSSKMAGISARMKIQTNNSGRVSMSSIASKIACRLVSSTAKTLAKSPSGRCLKRAVERATRGIMPKAMRVVPRSLLTCGFLANPEISENLYCAMRVMSTAGMAMNAMN